MDSFQGSSPPNFISFCLAKQPGDELQTQTNSAADIPDQRTQTIVSVGTSSNVRRPQLSPPHFPPIRPQRSPSSTDSNVDVTSYADEKLQLLEQAQQQSEGHTAEDSERREQETERGIPEGPSSAGIETRDTAPVFRTSTPTSGVAGETNELDLTQLETGLTIAPSSRTILPELLPTNITPAEKSAASFLQIETDESSSLCDVPKLPTGTPKVRWLGDETGTEEAGDTSSQASAPQLYAYLPIGNVADTAGEGSSTDTFAAMPDPMRPST